jgi:predicted outer membrane protein
MSSTGNSNNLFASQLLADHQAGDESILVTAVGELKG